MSKLNSAPRTANSAIYGAVLLAAELFEDNMQKREKKWNAAVAWLHEYTWGDQLVFHLACDSRKDRIDRFLTMINALRRDHSTNAKQQSIVDPSRVARHRLGFRPRACSGD